MAAGSSGRPWRIPDAAPRLRCAHVAVVTTVPTVTATAARRARHRAQRESHVLPSSARPWEKRVDAPTGAVTGGVHAPRDRPWASRGDRRTTAMELGCNSTHAPHRPRAPSS